MAECLLFGGLNDCSADLLFVRFSLAAVFNTKNTLGTVLLKLKVIITFRCLSFRHTYNSPLVLNWSPDQVINRWKISVDLFSRLFLADGPGAERDSFLAARAGVPGRLAR